MPISILPTQSKKPRDDGAPNFLEPSSLTLRMIANKSSSPRQEAGLLLGIALILAIMSLRFVILGAWPVAIYSAIDVAILAGALNYIRRSRPAEEWLTIADGQITHWSIDDRGRKARVSLPAHWTKLQVSGGPCSLDLALWFRSKRHPIALCLPSTERREVATIVKKSLSCLCA